MLAIDPAAEEEWARACQPVLAQTETILAHLHLARGERPPALTRASWVSIYDAVYRLVIDRAHPDNSRFLLQRIAATQSSLIRRYFAAGELPLLQVGLQFRFYFAFCKQLSSFFQYLQRAETGHRGTPSLRRLFWQTLLSQYVEPQQQSLSKSISESIGRLVQGEGKEEGVFVAECLQCLFNLGDEVKGSAIYQKLVARVSASLRTRFIGLVEKLVLLSGEDTASLVKQVLELKRSCDRVMGAYCSPLIKGKYGVSQLLRDAVAREFNDHVLACLQQRVLAAFCGALQAKQLLLVRNCAELYHERCGPSLSDLLEEEMLARGKGLLQRLRGEPLVEGLMRFEEEWSSLIQSALPLDSNMYSLRLAAVMDILLNKSEAPVSLPALLAESLDSLHRKEVGEAELEARQKAHLRLLKHLASRDIFLKLYQDRMCKRMLTRRSVTNIEREERMAVLFRLEFGAVENLALEQLLASLKEGQLLSKALSDRLGRKTDFVVFNEKQWQHLPAIEIPPLPAVQQLEDSVRQFFQELHPTKRLRFAQTLSTAVLEYKLDRPTPFLLELSGVHASMVLELQARGTLSREGLRGMYGLGEHSLQFHLGFLERQGIVRCRGEETQLNPEFVPRRTYSQLVQFEPETQRLDEQTKDEREVSLQALVVKVLKVQKCMGREELIERVRAGTRKFRAQRGQVELAILKLKEKEFIREESRGEERVLVYVA